MLLIRITIAVVHDLDLLGAYPSARFAAGIAGLALAKKYTVLVCPRLARVIVAP